MYLAKRKVSQTHTGLPVNANLLMNAHLDVIPDLGVAKQPT